MKIYLRTKDYAQTGESFSLLQHPCYEMLVTDPQPKNLARYYNSSEYISHSDNTKGLINSIYQLIKRWALSRKIRSLSKFMGKGGRILDIGAGTAEFVLAATRAGWQAEGVEPNEAARNRAVRKGVHLQEDLNGVSGYFQVITLWHVLEHLPGLEDYIDQILERLMPGGTLVIALPNYYSWDARYYGQYWAAYDVPRHLWHFSQQAVKTLFKEKGLKVIETHPMWFDAFYVAILSEGFKGGRLKYLKAIWNGARSNLAAMRSGEFSSLTYVLKRL